MIHIAGANCIYFEPDNSGGVCKHPNMKRGFWIFSYQEGCVLTHKDKIECELRIAKILPVTKVIKMSKPKVKPKPKPELQPKPKKKAPHIHKKHIHKKEK